MDLQHLAYNVCKQYVRDQEGHIDAKVCSLVLGWIRARDLKRLCAASDYIPLAYSSTDLCRFSRQVAAFFKKNPAFSNSEECTLAAKQAFERAERLCRISNKKLDYYYLNDSRMKPRTTQILSRAEQLIHQLLGDIDDFVPEIPDRIRVTSGASATRSRAKSLPYQKIRIKDLPCTKSAVPFLKYAARHYGVKRMTFKEAKHNRVVTVPKNWKTDRTIACEPEGNLFLQLAFDGFVKDRLRQGWGIDLSDQFRNQQLAREGSIDGRIATIDLSMASDTVSINAVGWLLPLPWFQYLMAVRSPKGFGFGEEYSYAKLSSMGNGATFALETLIFAALSKATGASVARAYGDDIIISSDRAADLVEVLRFLGFRVNTDKSFISGPFRESCGADWYLGSNVTPFYMRAQSSVKTELCHLVNGLAPLTHPGGHLSALLLDIVSSEKLPLVPWNWSSISGVWVHPSTAYSLKLIRTKGWLLKTRAFTPRTKLKVVDDSRTLFLWHLFAGRRERGETSVYQRHFVGLYTHTDPQVPPTSSIISSKVPIYTHRYTRKWVCWQPPALVTPVHLYWWSELLSRREAG